MKNFSENFILGCRYVLPNPFTIAILLTVITMGLALGLTQGDPNHPLPHVFQITQYWQAGFWDLLAFTMQMMLILVLGHTLALSPVMIHMIRKIAKFCNTTSKAACFVSITTLIFGLINWGLGLIIGAILARKIGDQAAEQNQPINYPLVGAAGYLCMLVWHGGLSGSATLKIAEPDHFLIEQMGQIPVSQTIFSTMNLWVNLILILVLPIIFFWLGKNKSNESIPNLPKENVQITQPEKPFGAERLDQSKVISKLFALLILGMSGYILFFQQETFSLKQLNLNLVNFILFGLGLFCFKNLNDFMQAVEEAISGSTGILIQFPLYAGIAGIMQHSGLIHVFSNFIVEISTQQTYPLFAMLSAALVNIFVPSGGGQWVVQGPIIVEAAKTLEVPLASGVMAFAYGDQLTNMLQPFWALPLLGITKLKAYQVLPYTLISMIVGLIVFSMGLFFL